MKKKWGANRKRGSVVKCGKTPFEVGVLVQIRWDFSCMKVQWKLLNTFERIFGACLIGFHHKNAKTHSLCILLIN